MPAIAGWVFLLVILVALLALLLVARPGDRRFTALWGPFAGGNSRSVDYVNTVRSAEDDAAEQARVTPPKDLAP